MIRPRLVLPLVVGLVLVSGCGSGLKHASSGGGTIVFGGTIGGRDGTFVVRPDGSGFGRLSLGVSTDDDVYWNPAGTQALVVVLSEGPNDRAFLLDPATGKRRPVRVPHLYGVSLPPQPWSPDGRRLLLMHGSDTPQAVIYTVATRRAVAIGAPDYVSPVWSGDGRSVIFGDGHAVYTISAHGGARKLVARFPHQLPSDAQSSADGKWISFVDSMKSNATYVVRANGSHLRRMAGATASAWSPSGERLAVAGFTGVGMRDLATGKRSFFSDPLDTQASGPPSWSPDGRWILFERSDVAGSPTYDGLQLWAMRPDGRSAHPLTHASPFGGADWRGATWVAASLSGKPVFRPPLVTVRPEATLTTQLPVVALSASGVRAALAEGFGHYEYLGQPPGQPESGGPLGPILLWSEETGGTARVAVHGCAHVPAVVLGSNLGYVCDNSEYEEEKQSLRVGSATLARTEGGQGIGSFLVGTLTDGRRVVFGLEVNPVPTGRHTQPPQLRIYEATSSGRRLLRRFSGFTDVESVEGGRIAVLSRMQNRETVTVLSGHGARRFARPGATVTGAALDGMKLALLESRRLTVWDIASGRRDASWPTQPEADAFEGARGNLAVYVTGPEIHVMRLSDGREIVLNLGPNATGPALASFGSGGLFYAFEESYAKRPGRVGFVSTAALERAVSAHGTQAR